jgi:hypothetical protein
MTQELPNLRAQTRAADVIPLIDESDVVRPISPRNRSEMRLTPKDRLAQL